MAARQLRYEWFETLQTQHKFEYVLTAHHVISIIKQDKRNKKFYVPDFVGQTIAVHNGRQFVPS